MTEALSADALLQRARADLAALTMACDVRPASSPSDDVDGVAPAVVLAPRDAAAVAGALQWAGGLGLGIVIRGSGSKLGWGRPPARVDAVVAMDGLHAVRTHRAGDLTITVEAGAALADVNRQLAAHGQWLPLDSSFGATATIGGLIATNDSGPLRHRFGTPRDLVIGIELATVDGRVAKAGGQVVKNVAGYDLSRLMSGSFGALAAIVAATFKLQPLSPARATLRLPDLDSHGVDAVVTAFAASQLEPTLFELQGRYAGGSGSTTCLVRFVNVGEVVAAQVDAAAALAASLGVRSETLRDDEQWWRERGHPGHVPDAAVVRASWLPARAAAVVDALAALSRSVSIELEGRAAIGAGVITIDGELQAQTAAIGALRGSSVFGNVVVTRGSAALRSQVDPWGTVPNQEIFRAIKRSLDPRGVLGAGRGPF